MYRAMTQIATTNAFGCPMPRGTVILAPADGTVRSVVDGHPNMPPGELGGRPAGGNQIALEVAPREFLFLCHLQPGSITVQPGDQVAAGQVLGRVGNSGNTSEPHLHIHLQDSPNGDEGEGIPNPEYRQWSVLSCNIDCCLYTCPCRSGRLKTWMGQSARMPLDSEVQTVADELFPNAEREVLACLCRLGAATVRQVREEMEAYRPMMHASVFTLLKRLEAKGAVTREKGPKGKAFVYKPAVQPVRAYRQVVKDLVDRIFGGSGVELVSSLFETRPPTPDEIEQLQELLDQLRQKSSKRGQRR